MATLTEQHADAIKSVEQIHQRVTAEGRKMTDSELEEAEAFLKTAGELEERIQRAQESKELLDSISRMKNSGEPTDAGDRLLSGIPFQGGEKGHMFLSGAGGKLAAKQIAARILKAYGTKAFLGTGAVTTTIPLSPDGPIALGKVPNSILDALRTTVRDAPVYRYLRQTAFTNNAAIVAPGGTKPTSVITVDDVDGALQVFAHLSETVDEYLLRDNDTLASFIASQLLYGLQRKVEAEVLNGDGTTGHLTGLLNTSGIQTQAFATDKLTTLRTAALKLEQLGYTADLYVVNSADWAAIETTRATSGSFDLGGPIDRAAQRVWGTQVVTSPVLAAGTALALDLDAATVDTDTHGVETKWDSSGVLFEKNQIRARVEGRFGVSVMQPAAIVKATLTSE